MKVLEAQPNPAHRAIVALAQHVPKLTVVTQNVDDLHERAGSQNVLHLHEILPGLLQAAFFANLNDDSALEQ
jgi:NAD-dependent SIR2 family protein deacetylase